MKQTLTYLSKTIVPQLLTGDNRRYDQMIQGIRVVDLTVKLGTIKPTYIPEQHFDLIDIANPETYMDMTVAGGLFSTGKAWGDAFCSQYTQVTGKPLSVTIDPTNTYLIFNGTNDILIQRTEPVVVKSHVAYVSFSATGAGAPSSTKIACPIPDGLYVPKSYAAALKSALNIQTPGNQNISYDVTFDRSSNRMKFYAGFTVDNDRYLFFNDAAADYLGFDGIFTWHRYGGEDKNRVATKAPRQLNATTPDLTIVGFPYGIERGVIQKFDKPYISIDGSYDAVFLCSNALGKFGQLLNGTDSNVIAVLPTMGILSSDTTHGWVRCDYAHRGWHEPTGKIGYNSIDFYITDASGHVFQDARFIVTLEIQ